MDLKQKLVRKLRKEFPAVKFKSVKLVIKGWDHDVLVLDNKFIFRFAKEKLYKGIFGREIKFLKWFVKKSNLRVPDYQFVSKDKAFGGYPMIKGRELTNKLYQKLPLVKRKKIIKDLAKFLSVLHNIKPATFQAFGFPKYYAYTEDKQWLKKEFWPKMSRYLSSEQKDFIKEFITNYYRTQSKIKPVLGHFDLSHYHILIDKSGNIGGIIDFGDMNLSDPAREFNGFEDYDNKLPAQIYKFYHGPKDSSFLNRSHDHYIHRWIYLLYDGKIRRKNVKLWKEANTEINKIIASKNN